MLPPVLIVRQPNREALYIELHDRLEMGRDCDGLLLADAQVSRRHIEVRVQGDRVLVADLDSSNGTYVAGQRISGPVELRTGTRAQLGGTTVELLYRQQPGFDDRLTAIGSLEADNTSDDLRRTSIELVSAAAARDQWRPVRRPTAGSTTTIVFSDIESSTELTTSLGDRAWYDLLERHNEAIRREVMKRGGAVVKSQGDGFMLTFPSAHSAVQFAINAQRAIDGQLAASSGRLLRVRIGMHTGEALSDPDGDLFGRHVIIAARIANLATGGEVLVSSLVHDIVSTSGDFVFGPARIVELKGIPGDYTVHALDWHG